MAQCIPLTQGKFAIIDDADFEWLMQWKWYAHKQGHTWYVVRTFYMGSGRKTRKTCSRSMHREILKTPVGLETDHINGDGLDNRRSNLRVCTRLENAANQLKRNPVSGLKGVGWHKQIGRWRAYIERNYKQIHLGLFDNREDAARAYDRAARQYFGEFARTNF